jgi:hypothetical protein
LTEDDVSFDFDADGISVTHRLAVAWMSDPDRSVLTVFRLEEAP